MCNCQHCPLKSTYWLSLLCINRSSPFGLIIMKINRLSHVGETMNVFPKQLRRFHSALKKKKNEHILFSLISFKEKYLLKKCRNPIVLTFFCACCFTCKWCYWLIPAAARFPVTVSGYLVHLNYTLEKIKHGPGQLQCFSNPALLWQGALQWFGLSCAFLVQCEFAVCLCVLEKGLCVPMNEWKSFLCFIENDLGQEQCYPVHLVSFDIVIGICRILWWAENFLLWSGSLIASLLI